MKLNTATNENLMALIPTRPKKSKNYRGKNIKEEIRKRSIVRITPKSLKINLFVIS